MVVLVLHGYSCIQQTQEPPSCFCRVRPIAGEKLLSKKYVFVRFEFESIDSRKKWHIILTSFSMLLSCNSHVIIASSLPLSRCFLSGYHISSEIRWIQCRQRFHRSLWTSNWRLSFRNVKFHRNRCVSNNGIVMFLRRHVSSHTYCRLYRSARNWIRGGWKQDNPPISQTNGPDYSKFGMNTCFYSALRKYLVFEDFLGFGIKFQKSPRSP